LSTLPAEDSSENLTIGKFDWSIVKDEAKRERIIKWKAKKARIAAGKSHSTVYLNRKKYAKSRPRVNGRFVSKADFDRMMQSDQGFIEM
jgi:hypothetical protein